MSERDDVMALLQANASKNFVKRILSPEKYPSLDMGNGQRATHLMAWGEADGKYYVFPTILYDGKKLVNYGAEKAFPQAMRTGNVIEFDTPEKADWFSKKYKLAWQK